MEKIKLCGSTSDLAEIEVDYKNQTTKIIGVPESNTINRLKSALFEWTKYLAPPYFGLYFLMAFPLNEFGINVMIYFEVIVKAFLVILVVITSFHLNKKFDFKVKKWFAVKTGKKERNKIRINNFKTNEFIIPDFKNIVLEFEASGDVSKQLNKIKIEDSHRSSQIIQQANLLDVNYLKDYNVWNARFIFEERPKDGELYLEYI